MLCALSHFSPRQVAIPLIQVPGLTTQINAKLPHNYARPFEAFQTRIKCSHYMHTHMLTLEKAACRARLWPVTEKKKQRHLIQ